MCVKSKRVRPADLKSLSTPPSAQGGVVIARRRLRLKNLRLRRTAVCGIFHGIIKQGPPEICRTSLWHSPGRSGMAVKPLVAFTSKPRPDQVQYHGLPRSSHYTPKWFLSHLTRVFNTCESNFPSNAFPVMKAPRLRSFALMRSVGSS